MVELLDIHLNFLCRKQRTNKKGQSPIVLRIVFRQERRDIFTGLYCEAKNWNPEAAQVKTTDKRAETINRNMAQIAQRAVHVLDRLKFSRTPFTIDEIVAGLKDDEDRPVQLCEYLNTRVREKEKKNGIEFTSATYEKYERCGRFVMEFVSQEFKAKNYLLTKVDSTFLDRFYQYLRSMRSIGNNTAVKYLSFFRTLLMPAMKAGILRQDLFADSKFRIKTVPKGFLTDEELELLIQAELASEDLERIRDQYLFCCYTGLAYSDLKQLHRQHFIQQKEGGFYILKPRQKTGQDSIIPLLPAAQAILQKYSPTSDFRDFRWHVSANQKMNQRLKAIGEKARLSKPLHMHLARHTFATTITLSKGVPIESVSSMLGHASLRQTQHYAKIVATKVINDMAKIGEIYK